MIVSGDSGPRRIEFRAEELADAVRGLAVSGEPCRSLRLVELIDAELCAVDRVAAVKTRRRGLSAGAVTVAIAEAQLVGAECFDDLQDVRSDRAGASLRAVAQTPSPATARQLATASSRRISTRSSGQRHVVATSLIARSVATRARM